MSTGGGTIEIRRARIKDAADIARFGYASWQAGIALHVGDVARSRDIHGLFLAFARDFHAELLVAAIDGRLAGFGATEHGDNFISDIWVAPEYFRRGVGSALLQALERIIRERGYDRAGISALSANERAIGLYRRQGYDVVKHEEVFDEALGEVVGKTYLQKRL